MYVPESVQAVWDVDKYGEEEQTVDCLWHEDTRPSASLNVNKGKFHCHACGKSFSSWHAIENAIMDLGVAVELESKSPAPVSAAISASQDLSSMAIDYLRSRGIDYETATHAVNVSVDGTTGSQTCGYMRLESRTSGSVVYCNLLASNGNPKYWNPGKRVGFEVRRDSNRPIWFVEGVFDALALYMLGFNAVATLGSKVPPALLYPYRSNRNALTLFDNDYAGWDGAQKLVESLRLMGGNANVADLAKFSDQAEDPSQAYTDMNRDELIRWLQEQEQEVGSTQNDLAYVGRLLTNSVSMQTIPTTLPRLDYMIGGGLKEGVTTIAAPPGAGKSSLCVFLASRAAVQGKRVLILSYELSKRQYWSRLLTLASGAPNWSAVENRPDTVANSNTINLYADKIRISTGWTVPKIEAAAKHYDMIVVDYIQRVPNAGATSHASGQAASDQQTISSNISALSNIGRDEGKVILVISSVPRAYYGTSAAAPDSRMFKETGSIEYVSQLGISLAPLAQQADEQRDSPTALHAQIIKNTRGAPGGSVFLRADLARQTFAEISE